MIDKIAYYFKALNERQILLLLLGIAFGLRLYAVLMAKGIAYDGAGYGFMARDFIKGEFLKGLSSPLHPFYPLLISLISPDTGHVEIAGRMISLVFGTFTLIPVYYLAREIVGQREAIFTSLFYAFHPYLATYSGMLLSEATYWGLLTLSVYFFWKGLTRKRILGLIAAGAFLTFAYLTRPEGIGYLFVYLIWVIFYDGFKKGWVKKLVFMGGLVLPIFILTVPYLIHIHRETGQWLISKKALGVQSQFLKWSEEEGNLTKGIGGQKTEEKNSKMMEVVNNIIQYLPFTTYHYLRAYHFTLWLFLFFGLIRVRQKVIIYELFLASLVLFHLFSLSTLTSSTIRFSVPIIPLSLFWAGAGALEMKRLLQKYKNSNPGKWVSLIILFAVLTQLPQSLRPERRHRADQKKVGLWLQQNTPQDAIIMSNSPQETFYADREFMMLPLEISTPGNPAESYNEMIHYAKTKGVRYILVNKNTYETNPGLMKSIQSTDLREIFRKADQALIIYEVIY